MKTNALLKHAQWLGDNCQGNSYEGPYGQEHLLERIAKATMFAVNMTRSEVGT